MKLPKLAGWRFRPVSVAPRVLQLLRVLAWGYLAASLVYVALLWAWGDRWWLATILLFVPRWPVLVPALVLALVTLPIRPRLLLPIALGALVTLVLGMGYRLGWRRWLAGSAQPDLRIVTFNLDAIDNPRLFAAPLGLAAFRPDVVAFEECAEGIEKPEHWPAGWTARYDDGMCLASRFPVLTAKTIERITTGDQGGTGSVMFYRLQTPSGPLDLAVIHLETPRKGLEPLRFGGDVSSLSLNQRVREVGSRRLSRWIADQSKEAVVVGDFNMPVESTIYRAFWSDCTNAFSSVGTGFGATRHLRHFSVRIDHVLSCGGWRPLRAVVGPDLGSDHLPLIVDLARRR